MALTFFLAPKAAAGGCLGVPSAGAAVIDKERQHVSKRKFLSLLYTTQQHLPMRIAIAAILSLIFLPAFSQDVIDIDGVACGIHGSAKPGSMAYMLDGFKNRYNF